MTLYEREFLKVSVATASLPGSGGPEGNQDQVGHIRTKYGDLLVVADGHEPDGRGGRAARLVVETVFDYFRNWDGKGPRKMLVEAIGMANAAYQRALAQDGGLRGVAVSVTILHHHDGAVRIAHVGKCRAYRQRNYVIDQLTEDHVVEAEEKSAAGQTLARLKLDRAIGLYPIVEVDVSDAQVVQAGETFILCSDGLTLQVSDLEIGRYVLAGDPDKVCHALLSIAGEDIGLESNAIAMIKFTAQPGHARPLPRTIQSFKTEESAFHWSKLSRWWKVRLIALGVLALWFFLLLLFWWHADRGTETSLGPAGRSLLLAGGPWALTGLARLRRRRPGGRR